MSYFAQMLMTKVQPLYDEGRTPGQMTHMARVAEGNTLRAIEKYRKVFGGKGKVKSGAELNAALGLQKASVFMKTLESRGLAERCGTRPTGGSNPTILWKWIGD